MPGPPPPPPAAPPPMMPPPPPTFNPGKGGGADDRGALLKSIRQGAKLKKTVTVDKSAPVIPGKITSTTSNNSISGGNNSGPVNSSPAPMTNGLGLGGLFAGGMPKLRPTGRQLDGFESNTSEATTNTNGNNRTQRNWQPKPPDVPPSTPNNFNNIQNQLKKQLANENSRNRGPPPPAPTRNTPEEPSQRPYEGKNGISNNFHQQSQSSLNLTTIHANVSTLHRKAVSNVNVSTIDGGFINNNVARPAISHGKPNLAPKPPVNGKPAAPPKKLMINGKPVGRAQSMKTPRSPSPQSPENNNHQHPAAKFGTVRNLTSVIGNSLAASTGNLTSQPRQRPMLNMRPNGPPPSIPQPPPSGKVAMKPPNHAPPPPPTQAPPPPPHKTHAPQVPTRAPPAIPTASNGMAPPPPPRHSSIRGDGSSAPLPRRTPSPSDLDVRFAECFRTATEFPRPTPYRRIFKVYPSKSVSKQQAPQPPSQLQSRTWDTQAC